MVCFTRSYQTYDREGEWWSSREYEFSNSYKVTLFLTPVISPKKRHFAHLSFRQKVLPCQKGVYKIGGTFIDAKPDYQDCDQQDEKIDKGTHFRELKRGVLPLWRSDALAN